MIKVILNIGMFYVGWLAIVMSQSQGMGYVGHILAPSLLIAHLIFVSKAPKQELFIIPLFALLGYTMDALFGQIGFLRFSNPMQPAPLWLFELWLLFAMTLDYSMKAILDRPKLAAALGFFAPLTYLSGEFWQIVYYQNPKTMTMAVHGLTWALLLFCLGRVYKTMTRQIVNG